MATHPAVTARAYGPGQRARWTALAAEVAEPNAFYMPELLCAALDHLEAGEVRVLEAQAGGELVGLIPVLPDARYGRLPLGCVSNWMHRHCFFGAPLIRKGAEVAAWREWLDQLDAAPWARGFLHLSGLDAAGANAAALEALCVEQRRPWEEVHRYDRAMLRSELEAERYWETHVRAKKRKELRRLQKRLAELGKVESRLLTDREELAAWCSEFLALQASGWKGTEGTALACGIGDAAFFRAACAATFDSGELHFLRMDLDSRAIAMLVNFRHGEGAFSFKIAFDEALGRFSPGVLIEIANLHAVQGDPAIGWMDSCAAADHPMIDSLWAERRTITQYRIALRGHGLVRAQRAGAFALAQGVERVGRRLRGQE